MAAASGSSTAQLSDEKLATQVVMRSQRRRDNHSFVKTKLFDYCRAIRKASETAGDGDEILAGQEIARAEAVESALGGKELPEQAIMTLRNWLVAHRNEAADWLREMEKSDRLIAGAGAAPSPPAAAGAGAASQSVSNLLDPCVKFHSGDAALNVMTTAEGQRVRWSARHAARLAYFVDVESFPPPYEAKKVTMWMADAAGAWNGVCNVKFCAVERAEEALFTVRFSAELYARGDYALSFFPCAQYAARESRVIAVSPLLFNRDSRFPPAGVLRHELGHVLGFRHERFKTADSEMRDRGAHLGGGVDPVSVMEYPHEARAAWPNLAFKPNFDFVLSPSDVAGARKVYRSDADGYVEFDP